MFKRGALRAQINLFGKKIDSFLAQEAFDRDEAVILQAQYKDKFERLSQEDEKVLEKIENSSETQENIEALMLNELEVCEKYREEAIKRITLLEKRIDMQEDVPQEEHEQGSHDSPDDAESSSVVEPNCSTSGSHDADSVGESPCSSRSNGFQAVAEPTCSSTDSNTSIPGLGFRVPELKLDTFDGKDILKFPGWKDCFDCLIHHNAQLTPIQKFGLLKDSLKGSARTLVDGLLHTSENYQEAMRLLDSTYGDENLLLGLFVAQLHALQAVHNSRSPLLEELVCKFEQSYREIRNLIRKLSGNRINIESTSNDQNGSRKAVEATYSVISYFLTPHLLSKLPEDIQMRWYSKNEDPQLRYNFDELISFVKQVMKDRQACRLLATGRSERPSIRQEFPQRSNRANYNANYRDQNMRRPSSTFYNNVKPSESTRSRNGLTSPAKTFRCRKCGKSDHVKLSKCYSFLYLTIPEREDYIKKNNLCFKCLGGSHAAKDCRNIWRCKHCGGTHHSLICQKTTINKAQNKPTTTTSEVNQGASTSNAITNVTFCPRDDTDEKKLKSNILLQTLKLDIMHPTKPICQEIYALFDSGANHSWIEQSLAEKMELPIIQDQVFEVQVFGDSTVKMSSQQISCQLSSQQDNNVCRTFSPYTAKNLTSTIIQHYPNRVPAHLYNIVPDEQILRGTHEIKPSIIIGSDYLWDFQTGEVVKGKPTAIKTIFGWSLHGPQSNQYDANKQVHNYFVKHVENLWNLETIGIKEIPAQAEQIENPVLEGGYYHVRLPFINEKRPESNFEQARKRYELLERKNSHRKERFEEQFQQLLDLKIIERVENDDIRNGFYLPYHAVYKDDKIRIVFDGSSVSKNGLSLNDALDPGENLLNHIFDVFLRFRLYEYAYVGDIKRAFHSLVLDPDDRRWVKFIWQGKTFQFTRVVFGLTPSSYLLNSTLHYHFETLKDKNFAKELKKSTYVDDITTSHSTEKEKEKFSTSAQKELLKIGMELQHGVKNNKVLGTRWNQENDTIQINLSDLPKPKKYTKRELLKYLASIFDVLGLLTPFVLRLKILFQTTWIEKFSWDVPLNDSMKETWISIMDEIEKCNINFPRWTGLIPSDGWTLHVFSDASTKSYSCCAYMVTSNGSRLITSKARLCPIKIKLTIPRAELLGVLLGTRIAVRLIEELPQPQECYIWSDATTVLHWLAKGVLKAEIFIKNRVKEILQHAEKYNLKFRYVTTHQNVADLATKGTKLNELEKSFWQHGPLYLQQDKEFWPNNPIHIPSHVFSQVTEEKEIKSVVPFDIKRFSTLDSLLKSTAWLWRYMNILRKRKTWQKQVPSAEMDKALKFWLEKEQKIFYPQEIDILSKGGKLNSSSHLFKLRPIYDEKRNLIVIPTRLGGQSLVLLPPKSYLSRLIVTNFHEKELHIGPHATLSEVRNSYWLIDGLSNVKKFLHHCMVCRKSNAPPYTNVESSLQPFRITPQAPWKSTGVDHIGPFYLKFNVKAYILIFVCTVTRSVHLELCQDLSAEENHKKIRQFLALRIPPHQKVVLRSDNAKTFIKLSTMRFPLHQVTWKFIPERSPHWSGHTERLVGLVKKCLFKSFKNRFFDKEELNVILTEVMTILNQRPLTNLSTVPWDNPTLTPNHFLFGTPPPHLFDSYCTSNQDLKAMFLAKQKFSETFWSIWKKEYLNSLQQWRSKPIKTQRIPRIGDIILVKEGMQKNKYPLAKVVGLLPGRDSHIRAVIIQLRGKTTRRAVKNIYFLETTEAENIMPEVQPTSEPTRPKVAEKRA